MKKILIFVLLFCTVLSVRVYASELKIVTVDGDTVSAKVVSDFDFSALSFEMEYDNTALEFVSNKFSETLGGAIPMINPTYTENSVKVSILSADVVPSGEICEIQFGKKSQTQQDISPKLKNISSADINGNIIEVNTSDIQQTQDETDKNTVLSNSGSYGGSSSGLSGSSLGNDTNDTSQTNISPVLSSSEAHQFKFSDVNAADWCYEAIKFAFENGITNGIYETVYAPNDFVTRGQFITMLCRAYKIQEAKGDNFSDCGNTWYTGYLAAAKQLGISDGVGNNKFAPEKEITREETVTLIYNYLKSKDEIVSSNFNNITDFADSDTVSDWAKDSVAFVSAAGYINGKENNRFDPKGKTTRAELAQIFFNILSNHA